MDIFIVLMITQGAYALVLYVSPVLHTLFYIPSVAHMLFIGAAIILYPFTGVTTVSIGVEYGVALLAALSMIWVPQIVFVLMFSFLASSALSRISELNAAIGGTTFAASAILFGVISIYCISKAIAEFLFAIVAPSVILTYTVEIAIRNAWSADEWIANSTAAIGVWTYLTMGIVVVVAIGIKMFYIAKENRCCCACFACCCCSKRKKGGENEECDDEDDENTGEEEEEEKATDHSAGRKRSRKFRASKRVTKEEKEQVSRIYNMVMQSIPLSKVKLEVHDSQPRYEQVSTTPDIELQEIGDSEDESG